MKKLIFRPAEDYLLERKAKVMLYGASGSGKTRNALELAYYLVDGDVSKIVVIDTENKTASLNAKKDSKFRGFKLALVTPPFNIVDVPQYIQDAAELAGVGGVVILDSLSSFWSDGGGVLEVVAGLTGGDDKKNMLAWQKMKPYTNAVGQAIERLDSAHIIVTCKDKGESVSRTYTNSKTGRTGQKKEVVSTTFEGKQDWAYKFDVILLMQQRLRRDGKHILTISNDKPPRIEELSGKQYSIGQQYDKDHELWNPEEVAGYISHGLKTPEMEANKLRLQKDKLRGVLEMYAERAGTKHPEYGDLDLSELNSTQVTTIGKQVVSEIKNLEA